MIVEWGVPETDGGAPLLGYNIAIRDEKKTMWMEVGRVDADVQKFNIKDLQVYIFFFQEIGYYQIINYKNIRIITTSLR